MKIFLSTLSIQGMQKISLSDSSGIDNSSISGNLSNAIAQEVEVYAKHPNKNEDINM